MACVFFSMVEKRLLDFVLSDLRSAVNAMRVFQSGLPALSGTDNAERLFFFFLFSNENTACRNCKKTFALAQIYIVVMSIP